MIYLTFFQCVSVLLLILKDHAKPAALGFVAGTLLATFAAIRGSDVAADFLVYQDWYTNRDISNGYLERPGIFEWIYFFLNDFCEGLDVPFRVFLWLLAFASVYIKTIVIYRFSGNRFAFGLSMAIYVSTFYLLHEFTQIRAGLAIAMIFLAVHSLVRGGTIRFSFLVFLSAGFHSSALIAFFLIIPFRGYVAKWFDWSLIFLVLGSVFLTIYGVNSDLLLIDAFADFDPRVGSYLSSSLSGESVAVDPFAIRTALLLMLALSLAFIKVNNNTSCLVDNENSHAIILTRRSILIGISFLFLLSPVPELAVRLFEINIALIPILVAVIFSHRNFTFQKTILVLWGTSIFYVFVFSDVMLVKPYELFFG